MRRPDKYTSANLKIEPEDNRARPLLSRISLPALKGKITDLSGN